MTDRNCVSVVYPSSFQQGGGSMSANRRRGGSRDWGRYGWSLLLALGLLPGGGCLTSEKATIPEMPPMNGGAAATSLAPSAGAKVCLNLAATYEREAAAAGER